MPAWHHVSIVERFTMTNAIRLLKLKLKRCRPIAYLDDHLLRDLGVSRVVSEFAAF
jgi:uncharacterized protein YjiS (DUF1127 family)